MTRTDHHDCHPGRHLQRETEKTDLKQMWEFLQLKLFSWTMITLLEAKVHSKAYKKINSELWLFQKNKQLQIYTSLYHYFCVKVCKHRHDWISMKEAASKIASVFTAKKITTVHSYSPLSLLLRVSRSYVAFPQAFPKINRKVIFIQRFLFVLYGMSKV